MRRTLGLRVSSSDLVDLVCEFELMTLEQLKPTSQSRTKLPASRNDLLNLPSGLRQETLAPSALMNLAHGASISLRHLKRISSL